MKRFLSKAVTNRGDAAATVKELRRQFADFPARALLFFASHVFDEDAVAGLIQDAFPGVVTFGCTSYAEMGGGGIHRNSIAAMAFGDDVFDTLSLAVAENISSDPGAVDKAFADLEKQLGKKVIDLDFAAHFGISIFDGASPRFEAVIDRMAALADIVFIGGSASDDLSKQHVRVFLNGRTHRDAALLAVIKPSRPFTLLKTQSADPIGPKFTATKVSEADMTVFELDGKRAQDVFARGIGVAPGDLRPEHFLDYSLGVMAEGEPFLRVCAGAVDNGGLRFFYTIPEGQQLCLMKAGDIVRTTREALAAKRREFGDVAAILEFDCAYRDLGLVKRGEVDAYAKLFDGVETLGFASFGELFITGVAQTAVMVLFA